MHHQFGLTTGQSAWTYAVAALLGAGLYEVAGQWTRRVGAKAVLLAGYVVRGLALASIAAAIALHGVGLWAMLSFVVMVESWSFLSVAGNIRSAEVAPAGAAGTEIGAFYSVTMLAKVCGGLMAGALVSRIGYVHLLAFCALLIGCAAAWTALSVLQDHLTRRVSTTKT
jgi:MFS family permease